MTNVRAEVTHYLQGAVPRDYDVNVCYFSTPAGQDMQALANAIEAAFFTNSNFGWYAGYYGQVKLYDVAAVKPRPVLASSTYNPGTPWTQTSAFPQQVALCLSYYGTRNLPRQRGRMFIGPFNGSFSTPPSSGLLSSLIALGQALNVPVTGCKHIVWDVKGGGVAFPVTDYWVDNRWDTQRRRLPKATARTTAHTG